MIERARWIERADAPQTPLGRYLGRERRRGIPITWLFFAIAVPYALASAAVSHFFTGVAAEVLGYVPLFILVAFFLSLIKPRAPKDLAPDPSPGRCFPSTVILRRDGRKTGEDRGVVAFADGWLVFDGENTSFAIRSADVVKVVRIDGKRWLLLEGEQTLEFGAESSFREILEWWCGQPPPDGLSRLPPLAPNLRAGMAFPAVLQGLAPYILGLAVGNGLAHLLLGGMSHFADTFGWIVLFALSLSGLSRLLAWIRLRKG